jgi:nucleoid DNA-binding protein
MKAASPATSQRPPATAMTIPGASPAQQAYIRHGESVKCRPARNRRTIFDFRSRFSHQNTSARVDIIIKTIIAALAAGDNVEINSFGKFVHVNGRRHVGRNFKTGETIEISAWRSVIFRPAKELRQVLDHSQNNILRSRQSSLESQLYIVVSAIYNGLTDMIYRIHTPPIGRPGAGGIGLCLA